MVKDPNFIGVTVKTVVLTLTTVITLCKGFQIASFIKGRDAEQRHLSKDSLIWLRDRMDWS